MKCNICKVSKAMFSVETDHYGNNSEELIMCKWCHDSIENECKENGVWFVSVNGVNDLVEDAPMTQREIDYSDTFDGVTFEETNSNGGVQLKRKSRKHIHPYTSRKCECCWVLFNINRMARYEIPSHIKQRPSYDLCTEHTDEVEETFVNPQFTRINRWFASHAV